MPQFANSRPIVIDPYRESWIDEFKEIGSYLRSVLEGEALRVDHIGSTSVPGLSAKDIIDIQVTVPDLDDMSRFIERMRETGYVYREGNVSDVYVGEEMADASQWRKIYFREAEGQRRVHIHVRQDGNLNQRYPLLFRDYLRDNATVRAGYEQIKVRLSEIFPESIEGYLYIKDPLMDAIFAGAEVWAKEVGWEPDGEYL